METIRVIIYKNHSPSSSKQHSGKNLLISQSADFDELLSECCRALGDSFKIIYNDRGKQIISVSSLIDGSVLYLSKGESFQLLSPRTTMHEPGLVILGSAGVGKSAITLRYTRNLFIEEYDPTIETFYKHSALVKGEAQNISILDTAGMEDYYPLVDEWISQKQAILLVFSLELEDSLKKIEDYHEKIAHRFRNESKPVLALIGNKNDLPRVISADEGKRQAEKMKCKYFEVSAFTGEGINEMFADIICDVKNRLKPPSVPWYRKCCLL